MKTQRRSVCILVTCLLAGNAMAQGSLTPPGAPAPTMKTLDQIEPRVAITNLPYTISSSGAYYLTSDLTGTTGTNGISIASDNVTLDLNGFSLIGVPGSVDGVLIAESQFNIAIRNGTVRDWGGDGLDLGYGRNLRVADMCVQTNAGRGIYDGYSASLIENCTAMYNGSDGIFARYGGTMINCAASYNAGHGLRGSDLTTIQSCVAAYNTADGIHLESGGSVIDCVSKYSGEDGIHAAHGAIIKNCVAISNGDNGFFGDFGTLIQNCMAHYNTGDGIEVDEDSMVIACSVKNSGYLGTGSGVHAAGANNRIEANNLIANDAGVTVDVAGNLIIRNSTSDNTTNYVLTGIQTIGPIITATGTVTNLNPWANFDF